MGSERLVWLVGVGVGGRRGESRKCAETMRWKEGALGFREEEEGKKRYTSH